MPAGGLGRYSQQTLLTKAEDPVSGDNQVVEDFDLHRRRRQHQGSCQYFILFGWLYLPIGVIVGEYQGGSTTP